MSWAPQINSKRNASEQRFHDGTPMRARPTAPGTDVMKKMSHAYHHKKGVELPDISLTHTMENEDSMSY